MRPFEQLRYLAMICSFHKMKRATCATFPKLKLFKSRMATKTGASRLSQEKPTSPSLPISGRSWDRSLHASKLEEVISALLNTAHIHALYKAMSKNRWILMLLKAKKLAMGKHLLSQSMRTTTGSFLTSSIPASFKRRRDNFNKRLKGITHVHS